jgi:hypothetical protein
MTDSRLSFSILPQPDETTCGPTCLHAVYRYFGDDAALPDVIAEVPTLQTGGTLGALLGCHALDRGYQATLYTCNLHVFDPSWFRPHARPLTESLRRQAEVKDNLKLRFATDAYIGFLERGGRIRMEDLSPDLIRRYLRRQIPVITGLSATWLYQDARERVTDFKPDDIAGEPSGHFVVLSGYDSEARKVNIADPYTKHPHGDGQLYEIALERVLCAMLLGIVTYDANLLIIRPK